MKEIAESLVLVMRALTVLVNAMTVIVRAIWFVVNFLAVLLGGIAYDVVLRGRQISWQQDLTIAAIIATGTLLWSVYGKKAPNNDATAV